MGNVMITKPQRIIGSSYALARTLEHASQLAEIDRSVLICGERGTGKELIAERLHYLSKRWDQQFISLNCATLSEELLESELFGHEQGAFTGATKSHKGRFERAHSGTLFLDELGTLPMRAQEKLLRVLEYGEFERLGGSQTISVDVRVIAATNADLIKLAKEGLFRSDLLDRLAFDVVNIPPLRHRKEDLEELAEFFAIRFTTELGWDVFPGFSEQALTTLFDYEWPGNVRELKNVIERSVFRTGQTSHELTSIIINPFALDHEPLSKIGKEETDTSTVNAAHSNDAFNDQPIDYKHEVERLQRELVSKALGRHQHNQRKAANYLGLTYDQFRGLVRKFTPPS